MVLINKDRHPSVGVSVVEDVFGAEESISYRFFLMSVEKKRQAVWPAVHKNVS